MKRAHQHRQYRDVHEFEAPEGVVHGDIDADNGLLPAGCPKCGASVYRGDAAGRSLQVACGARTQVAGWIRWAPSQRSGILWWRKTETHGSARARNQYFDHAGHAGAAEPAKNHGVSSAASKTFQIVASAFTWRAT